ncbi:eCIS core domain-containing protein [Methanobacterium formicicum]|uniref:eCIS core domain-containing protein n=1 Tax=Methanobacterium formicicum TaxID=2162 RepID=UPI002412A683|nr:DUF4157 domain-containing protein [Methanobacterium formicicum]MDG3548145.1 DUF4157 domain-containing protein [Methanobacterium formicicum]
MKALQNNIKNNGECKNNSCIAKKENINAQERRSALFWLQKIHGNQYTQNMAKKEIEIDLEIQKENYNQATPKSIASQKSAIQKQPKLDEEDLLTKRNSNQISDVVPNIESKINILKGNGQRLDNSIRDFMEPRFGHELSHVRIHTSSEANNLNKVLHSRAFTTGNDIFFREGEYNPTSNRSRELIAHELTHVIQQGIGIQGNLAISQPTDVCEQEAEQTAKLVMQMKEPTKSHNDQSKDSNTDHIKLTDTKMISKNNFLKRNCDSQGIYRWNAGDHEEITSKAGNKILSDPMFVWQISKHSSLMDYTTKRLTITGPAFLLGIIKGEGPEHGEDGNYSSKDENAARAQNLRLQNEYLNKAVSHHREFKKRLKEGQPVHKAGDAAGKTATELGNACHIAQDRGSHGEGVKGKGHDDPRTSHGWNPDDKTDNALGYAIAMKNTAELFAKWRETTSGI